MDPYVKESADYTLKHNKGKRLRFIVGNESAVKTKLIF
ncbi:hypothetical protein AC062_0325 [Pasteurellaceae bacterium NI1060]|nr:hypothetical protein AC062_0325 [Pasteurellaceae bacterium NI1060]